MSPVRAALLNKVALILSLAGMVIAGNLTYAKFSNKIVPCGISHGCEDVSNHPSSMFLGLPVAVYGLAAYLVLALIAAMRMVKGMDETRTLGVIAYGAATVGAIVSIGLQMYSILVIQSMCSWCIWSAVIMTVLFIVQAMVFQSLAGTAPSEVKAPAKKSDFAFLVATTVLGLAAMVASGYITNNSGKPAPKYIGQMSDIPRLVPKGAKIQGPESAPITIIEFGDLCCPACHKAYALVKDLMREHPGKIRFGFRHFPLVNMHKNSYRASVYAEVAAEQDKFWEFIDKVNQTPPEEVDNAENLDNMIMGIGLNARKAGEAFNDTKSPAFDQVYNDFKLANDLGIQSTPTFFVIVEGERPFSMQIGDILRLFDNDPKIRKLLGKE